jgi:inosine-uridine nucleoside N-ribohydrolase
VPDLDRLASGPPSARLCAAIAGHYVRQHHEEAHLHDPLAALAALEPDLFGWESRRVRCETPGEHTKGMTVVDRRPGRSGPVEVAMAVDAAAAHELIMAAILSA